MKKGISFLEVVPFWYKAFWQWEIHFLNISTLPLGLFLCFLLWSGFEQSSIGEWYLFNVEHFWDCERPVEFVQLRELHSEVLHDPIKVLSLSIYLPVIRKEGFISRDAIFYRFSIFKVFYWFLPWAVLLHWEMCLFGKACEVISWSAFLLAPICLPSLASTFFKNL